MDEVRLGVASVNILPVVRGLPSETSTVADAIRTTNPNVVALSIGPEELQTLRVYHGGPLEPENFEEEIYVAGLSAWEPPLKPPPCFTEAIRIAEKRGTRLEALDMDEVTYTENYVDCVSTLEIVFQGGLHGGASAANRCRRVVRARGDRSGTDQRGVGRAPRLAPDVLGFARVSKIDRVDIGTRAVDVDRAGPRYPIVLV